MSFKTFGRYFFNETRVKFKYFNMNGLIRPQIEVSNLQRRLLDTSNSKGSSEVNQGSIWYEISLKSCTRAVILKRLIERGSFQSILATERLKPEQYGEEQKTLYEHLTSISLFYFFFLHNFYIF